MTFIMLALDVDSLGVAETLANETEAKYLKVNHRLMNKEGFSSFYFRMREKERFFFFDLKLADTPDTNAAIINNLCTDFAPHYISVRSSITKCVEAVGNRYTKIIEVRYLTSDKYQFPFVTDAHGLVSNGDFITRNKNLNPGKIIIVPGFRLHDDPIDNHKVTTHSLTGRPNFAVVGRPIINDIHPRIKYREYDSAARWAASFSGETT